MIAHWGVEDPAAFTGSREATDRFFYDIARILCRRVQLLTSLPIEKLSRLKVEKLTRDIGEDRFATPQFRGAINFGTWSWLERPTPDES